MARGCAERLEGYKKYIYLPPIPDPQAQAAISQPRVWLYATRISPYPGVGYGSMRDPDHMRQSRAVGKQGLTLGIGKGRGRGNVTNRAETGRGGPGRFSAIMVPGGI